MKNSFDQTNQLVPKTTSKVRLGKPTCKINLSRYSLDEYKTFNPEGYTMLCRLGEVSDGLSYFPKTSRIVLDSDQQSRLMYNFEKFIPEITEDFGISQQAALEKSVDFFSNTQLTIKPVGIQGKFYGMMKTLQNYVPMGYTSEAVSVVKTKGITGLNIITQAPLTFVGATYIGALFFGYCGSVAGNNGLGLVLNSTSFVLSRPMRVVEITLNGLILRPVSNVIGLPLILNGTQQMLVGKGIPIQEYKKIGIAFERMTNLSVVKKIYKIIRNKVE